MAANNDVKRAWQELELLTEKGSRIVHYIIRDTVGNAILAVAGTERSLRHMFYTVSNDFLRVFGSTDEAHAGTEWRSRKEVVAWLISVVSGGGPIFTHSIRGFTQGKVWKKYAASYIFGKSVVICSDLSDAEELKRTFF